MKNIRPLLRYALLYYDPYDFCFKLVALFRTRFLASKFIENYPNSSDFFKIIEIYDDDEI